MSTEASEVKQEPKKLSKAEERVRKQQQQHLESINKAAGTVQTMLCNRFFDCFLECMDPESPEVEEIIKRVSAQWKMYCKRMKFQPESYSIVEVYCHDVIQQYKAEKYGKPEQAQSDPAVDAAGASESNKTEGAASGDAVVS